MKHEEASEPKRSKSKRMDESTGGTKMVVSKLMLPVK